MLLAGCAGVPSSSAPQAIGTVERPAPSNLPKPTPGMDPDVLLREFLKATADPANRHLAARQFLTQSASNAWDDAGSALLIDHVVFVETRGAERVSANMRADILGSLSDVGVFETAEGMLPDPGPIELVKTSGGWRIDRLPNGVFLDWQQFQSTYKRNTLYFADPTGKTVVPDPRYVAVSDHDQLATELVSKLLAGPRPGDGAHGPQSAGPAAAATRAGDPGRRRQERDRARVTAARASSWRNCPPPIRTAGNCLPRRSFGRWPGPTSEGPT